MKEYCFDYNESTLCCVAKKGKSTIVTAFLEILTLY